MEERKNWFALMQSGVYIAYVDRMALYDPSAIGVYNKGFRLSNTGEIIPIENEIVEAGMTILTMIDVDKRGYSFSIKNKNLIKEIVEILYNHISACIELKNRSPLDEYPVPLEDLIDMENFMMKVLKANPKLLVEEFSQSLEYRLRSSTMSSMFDRPTVTAKTTDEDKYRRVTTSGSNPYGDLDIDDLLNDI
jgi:hypothetical protein